MESPRRKQPPHKGSEDYFDRRCRVSTATPLVEDVWLYEWTRHPPEVLLNQRTVFRQCTPSEVTKNEWTVLKPAAKEAAAAFGIQKPEALNDLMLDAAMRSAGFEWLSLNRYPSKSCLMGICGNYVVAAAPSCCHRQDFIPAEQYRRLQEYKALNLKYRSKFRLFCAKSDVGYFFTTERQGLQCEVSYRIDAGVHGLANLWPVITANGTYIPAPCRISLTADLQGLPEKIEQLNLLCREYVQRLDWSFLCVHGRKSIFNWIRRELKGTAHLGGVFESLRKDADVGNLRTRLFLPPKFLRNLCNFAEYLGGSG